MLRLLMRREAIVVTPPGARVARSAILTSTRRAHSHCCGGCTTPRRYSVKLGFSTYVYAEAGTAVAQYLQRTAVREEGKKEREEERAD